MVSRSSSFATVVRRFVPVAVVLLVMLCPCDSFLPSSFAARRNKRGYHYIGEATIRSSPPPNGSENETSSTIKAASDLSTIGELVEQPKQPPSTGSKIIELAVPALGALMIDPLLTLADTAFVGRFSESANELAGMGSAGALLSFAFYLFNFLCAATTPLVASKRAAGNEKEALAVGGQALSLALGLGALLSTILITFQQPLLLLMGTGISGPEANSYAMDFLTIRALAAPAVFCISASTGILRGYLDTKTPIVILVLANVVNLLLDVLLIGFGHMGPAGAAIATTSAEWISATLFLGVLSGNLPSADGQFGRQAVPEIDEFGIRTSRSVVPSFSIPPWEEMKPLIVASSSLFLRSLSLQLFISAAAAYAARGGETGGAAASIAAHQIALQLWWLCSFTADSLAAAAQGLVADGVGRQDQDDVRDVTKTVFLYSGGLGLLMGAILQLGYSSEFLLNFFTSDSATQAALASILSLIILAQPLNSIVFAADGVIQGASEFEFQAKTMAISVASAVATFFTLQAGSDSDTLYHVWLSLIALQLVRGITSTFKIVDKDGPIQILGGTADTGALK